MFAAVLCGVPSALAVESNPSAQGWTLLLQNKPQKAREVFRAHCTDNDPALAGEAYRGLSEVDKFLGNDRDACRNYFASYLKDNNSLYLSCPLLDVILFSRSAWGYQIKEGYKVLKKLSKQQDIFAGQFQEDLAERYLNDGNYKKAATIIKQMGCIKMWCFIGPFDNISHSGYNKVYPPEKEINLSAQYRGKDGNLAKWHPLVSSPASAWIFVEDHLPISNAINYFYCCVQSPIDQEVVLSFGASGMFTIFLNNTVVLADSVFRNTGSDMFLQRVKLFKGANPLLVKLGHEWGQPSDDGVKLSNFSLRFLDRKYAPLSGISVSTEPAPPHPGIPAPSNLRPQPMVDSVVGSLSRRLEKNPDDIDAALLLLHFYNRVEMTDEGQTLASAWIKRYPNSAVLHLLLQESYFRAKKFTDAEAEAKAAYQAAPSNFNAWAGELSIVAESGDAQRIIQGIEQSPPHCKSSFNAEIKKLNAYAKLGNRNEIMKGIARLEKNHCFNSTAITILASSNVEQGTVRKAKKLIKRYLKHDRTCTSLYRLLSQIALKSGNVSEAMKALYKGLVYTPVDANAHFSLSRLALYSKNHDEALRRIDKALAIMPAGAQLLNLKGSILEAMGDKKGAKQAYRNAIALTNDDFNAWDNLRSLESKPGLDSLAPLPSVESLIEKSASWEKRYSENGAVLCYSDDIFYYPSKCSKERQFLVVYCGTQNAIDLWKEYTCGYNSNFQSCAITRALTVKSGNRQVPADIGGNQVVFKSLQPGDCIVLEWTIKNFYFGEMAKHVWGEQSFQIPFATHGQQFRLVTPVNDTIPYTVYGDSLHIRTAIKTDYHVITVSRPPYDELIQEKHRASDWNENPKVTYSTFSTWSQIADWYASLTAHVKDNALEVQALADSLFHGAPTTAEKLKRIHHYINNTIRYSFVSFRQSGWIPQAAHDIIATKIGDCKDMASLGKILFEKAGVPANLVLVNTQLRTYCDHASIGPDFNHCILSYTLDGKKRFVDFTDNSTPLSVLPPGDQAAMALVIDSSTTGPVLLPLDSAQDRRIERTVVAKLDEHGTLEESINTLRTGVLASGFRYDYRHVSPEKRTLQLHEILSKEYPDIAIDTFFITDIDSLSDSLRYCYAYRAKNTVTRSGAAAVFSFHLPDAVEAKEYPTAEKRYTPIDVTDARIGIGTQKLHAEVTIPAGWKPLSLPQNYSFSSPYGTYELAITRTGKVITCDRNAQFTAYRPIPIEEYDRFREFMNAVAKADAVQLVFTTP